MAGVHIYVWFLEINEPGQGDRLREKICYYTGGLAAAIAGFSIYSYNVRELLAAFTLFSLAFLVLALLAMGTLLVWFVSAQAATWAGLASRNLMVISRRLIAAYARV
jgi:hypothetical protein